MKAITAAIATLLISPAAASSLFDPAPSTDSASARQTEWIAAHNFHRANNSLKDMSWDRKLEAEAAYLAKDMATNNNCRLRKPADNKYGINFARGFGSDEAPTVARVMTLWEADLLTGGWTAGAMEEVLEARNQFVGCSDAFGGDRDNECYATICLYARG